MIGEAPGNADLSGQVAVVTGASRSIGRCIAERLAYDHATVVSLDLQAPEQGDVTIRTLEVDVSDEAGVREAFMTVRRDHGPIDILVNNAGLFSTLGRRPFWELDVDEWDRVMTVNVRSVFLCSRAASESMRDARRGCIVNLSSGSSSFGMAGLLHYVTSKAAIVGMTRSLARELGPFGITVNAVAPGLVTNEVTEQTIPEDYRRQIAATQVIQDPVGEEDVAGAVRYLCSPAARLVTGQTMLVNGGATMGAA